MLRTIAILLALFLGTEVFGQTSAQVEQSVRNGRRIVQEYERQEAEAKTAATQAQYERSMNHYAIFRNVCKPMWQQSALSRREFIENVTKKRSEQRTIKEVCYSNEVLMWHWCGPNELNNPDPLNSTELCVGKQSDWPKRPSKKDFMAGMTYPDYDAVKLEAAISSYEEAVSRKYD